MTARTAIAVAALVRDGRVLLGHRHPARRWYPDCWDLIGGHVEPGELPHDAVIRECHEELAVAVHDPRPLPTSLAVPTLEMHPYLVIRWRGDPTNAAPDEHDDLRWFSADDVAGLPLAHPSVLDTISAALRLASA